MTDEEIVASELLAATIFAHGGPRSAWREATDEQRQGAREYAGQISHALEDQGVRLVPKMSKAKVALRELITVPAHRAYVLPVSLD